MGFESIVFSTIIFINFFCFFRIMNNPATNVKDAAVLDKGSIGDYFMLCPEGHTLPATVANYAKDFSGRVVDAVTLQLVFESGLYCVECDRAYGLSKLKEKEHPHQKTDEPSSTFQIAQRNL